MEELARAHEHPAHRKARREWRGGEELALVRGTEAADMRRGVSDGRVGVKDRFGKYLRVDPKRGLEDGPIEERTRVAPVTLRQRVEKQPPRRTMNPRPPPLKLLCNFRNILSAVIGVYKAAGITTPIPIHRKPPTLTTKTNTGKDSELNSIERSEKVDWGVDQKRSQAMSWQRRFACMWGLR